MILITLLLMFMSILTVGLCIEYHFFYRQSQKMIELQNEYRTYITTVKRAFRRNKNSERPINNELYALCDGTPDDEIVEESMLRDTFLVNRERSHLKESMITYLKEQKLDPLAINFGDWCNDTELPVKKSTQSIIRPRINKKRLITKSSHKTNVPFIWPIERQNFWLSSFFGPRKKINGAWGFHYGIDMAALKGTRVHAACAGTVVEARYTPGFGNTVLIAHNNRYKTRYAHLDTISVKIGKKVASHDVIGTVGETGYIRKAGKDGSHLHFEVYDYNKRVNPINMLPS